MKMAKKSAIACLVAVVSFGGVLGASAESLRRFAPGSVAVGGEIGRRMDARRLRLRIPAWCDVAEVRVADEKPVTARPGWFDVVRDFSKPVDIRLEFPMKVRLVEGTRAQQGLVAVMRGPCVYALDAAANGVRKQNCDLWRIDASRPLRWDKSRRGVVVHAEMSNRQHENRELLFTRYSSDNHDRTFFPVAVLKLSR